MKYFSCTNIWINANEDRDKAHTTAAIRAFVQSAGTLGKKNC